MRNRLFAVPAGESAILNKNKSADLGTLKNKSSGKRLFKYNYFNLITGDFSVLQNNKNKWFLQEILTAGSNGDMNLLPVLKKIASDSKIDEGMRQKSSEIAEIMEADDNFSITNAKLSASRPEDEKLINARKTLANIRVPQTAEILRLLRDKSVESKKLAVFMIGKFKLTDMLPEVCECLNIPGMEEDTVTVLKALGNVAGNELRRFYLKASGYIGTCKTILRLLSGYGTEENVTFIFERLWSNSRQIKEVALDCLINNGFKVPQEDKNRLCHLIYEITRTLTFLTSVKICTGKNNNEFLCKTVDKEYARWKSFLLKLLSITYSAANKNTGKYEGGNINPQTREDDNIRSIPEIVDIIFSKPRKPVEELKYEEKKLKKLQRFFPKEIPDYHEVIEDLINFDYNLISVWTKACTLRSLPGILSENLVESVVALLFSPESILQEEAVKLVARSDSKLYNLTSRRISDHTRRKLDKINTGKTDEKELLFEKTEFLSTLFTGIPEDELIFLAGVMNYYKSIREEMLPYAEGSIMWASLPGKPDPEVIILANGNTEKPDRKMFTGENVSFYILDMEAVDAFYTLFPERVFEIMKYIDENEK